MEVPEPHPKSISPRALAIAGWTSFAIAGLVFLALAWNVATRTPLVILDDTVTGWLAAHRNPAVTELMFAVTHIHSVAGVTALSLALAVVLARMRQWYWILTLTASLAGGMALNWILKLAYARARPVFDEPLLELSTFSFPSGHTAGSALFYGVLAAFLVSRFYSRRRRAAIVAAAIAAVATVAFSRVYLGAHFLSDVVAAACSSTAWLVLCLASGHALVRRRMAKRQLASA